MNPDERWRAALESHIRNRALREVRDAIDRTKEMSETTMSLLFGPGGRFEVKDG